MNKWSEIFTGLVLLIGSILIGWLSSTNNWTVFGKDIDFFHAAWIVLKGSVFWIVILAGLMLLILGISDLRD